MPLQRFRDSIFSFVIIIIIYQLYLCALAAYLLRNYFHIRTGVASPEAIYAPAHYTEEGGQTTNNNKIVCELPVLLIIAVGCPCWPVRCLVGLLLNYSKRGVWLLSQCCSVFIRSVLLSFIKQLFLSSFEAVGLWCGYFFHCTVMGDMFYCCEHDL